MTTIRRIDVLSAAKIHGTLMAVLGLIAGGYYAPLILSLAGLAEAEPSGGSTWPPLFPAAAIVAAALAGVLGFIGGALMALTYNILARIVGGLKVELG